MGDPALLVAGFAVCQCEPACNQNNVFILSFAAFVYQINRILHSDVMSIQAKNNAVGSFPAAIRSTVVGNSFGQRDTAGQVVVARAGDQIQVADAHPICQTDRLGMTVAGGVRLTADAAVAVRFFLTALCQPHSVR